MKILWLIKQVPDSLEVHMNSGLTLERDFVAHVLNKADESAVELALQMKDAYGATVTAMTMGPLNAENILRELLSRGVDHALLLTSPQFAGADTLATARTLAAAARQTGPFDLLIFGRRSADGETGQVGPMTCALLGIPCVANVLSAKLMDRTVCAEQLTEEGISHWEAQLPAALTLCEWSYPLRLPALLGLKTARSAEIPHLRPEDIGLVPDLCGLKGSPTRVVSIRAHSAGARPTQWITAKEAAQIIMQMGVKP